MGRDYRCYASASLASRPQILRKVGTSVKVRIVLCNVIWARCEADAYLCDCFLLKKNRKEESSVCGSPFCTYTRGYIRRRQVVGKQRAHLKRRPVPTAEEEKDAADRWRGRAVRGRGRWIR